MVNAFKYTKQLEDAGFSRQQAEIQLQIITEIVEGDLATKQDLSILKNDLEHMVQAMAQDLSHNIKQIEYRLTLKLGAFLVIFFTTMIALMRLWASH